MGPCVCGNNSDPIGSNQAEQVWRGQIALRAEHGDCLPENAGLLEGKGHPLNSAGICVLCEGVSFLDGTVTAVTFWSLGGWWWCVLASLGSTVSMSSVVWAQACDCRVAWRILNSRRPLSEGR